VGFVGPPITDENLAGHDGLPNADGD